MKFSEIVATVFFFIYVALNSLSAQENNLKILSSAGELSFHSENEESTYYLVTYERALRLSVKGPAKLVVFLRVNLPRDKTILKSASLAVQMDGLKLKKFVLPEAKESKGIYLGERSFFPSRAFKLMLDVPDGEHIFTFSVPPSVSEGVALRFELSKDEKKRTGAEREIEFSAFILTGGASDSYGKQFSGLFGLGTGFHNSFTSSLFLSLYGRYSLYPEEYHFFTTTNEIKTQSGAEHLLNVNGFLGFSVIHDNIFALSPLAGFYGNVFILGDATNILLGPSAGLQAGLEVHDKVDLRGKVLYTYDLLKDAGEKPVGGFPFASLYYSITMGIADVFFGYSGEYLMFPVMERIDESGAVTRFAINRRFYHSLICGYTF